MIYRAVRHNERKFHNSAYYSDINWTSLTDIIYAFKTRLVWHYLDVATALKTPDRRSDCVIASISCILIDTLSQFHFGTYTSGGSLFRQFVEVYIPALNLPIPTGVWQYDPRSSTVFSVNRYPEALYAAFRCGLLHEANILAYGALGVGTFPGFELVGLSEYNGHLVAAGPCPTIRIDAWTLCDSVSTALDNYVTNLLDPSPSNNILRTGFKRKFMWSFGVDIAASVL
jgi:hypothetical protein